MPTLQMQVRRVEPTPENLKRIGEVFTKAFADDPGMRAMVHDYKKDGEQFKRKQWYPRILKACAIAKAEFYVVDDFKGFSIWIPPGTQAVTTWGAIRAGLHVVLWHLGWAGVKRIMAGGMQEAERVQRDVAHIPNHMCHYLFFIGVLPECQGQGLSKLLLSPHVKLGDLPLSKTHDPQYPCWLESSTQKSRAVYLKSGFEDVQTVHFAAGETDELGYTKQGGPGVPMYCMVIRPDTSKRENADKN